jgi:predicted ATPase
VFTDRGVHDGLAYLRLDGCPELPELRDIPGGRYSGVFLLSPLAGYETDSARLEDPETARRVHHLIEEVYGELGYRLIPIPPAPVDLRARRVLEHVGFVVAAAPVPPAAWTPGPSATTRIP